MNNDIVEIYDGESLLVRIKSSIIPLAGSFISIRGKTWIITSVTFAIDSIDILSERSMRANIDVKEYIE